MKRVWATATVVLASSYFSQGSIIFSQDFSSSSSVSSYVSSTPNSGQWNDISTSGSSTVGINSAALQYVRSANSGSTASFTRTTDFDPVPSAIIYTLTLNVTGNNAAQTTAAEFMIGANFVNGSSIPSAADTYAKFGINFTSTSGTFSLRDISGSANSAATFSGNQNIMWVVNNSGNTLSYLGPDGLTYNVGNDKWDLWAGTTLAFDERNVTTSSESIADIKFTFDNTINGIGTIAMSDFEIQTLPESMQWSVISGLALLAICGFRVLRNG